MLLTNHVPLEEEPWALEVNSAGEISTSVLLVTAELGLFLEKNFPKSIRAITCNTALYSYCNPGYYAELINTPMVIMFIALIALTLESLIGFFKNLQDKLLIDREKTLANCKQKHFAVASNQ